MERMVIKSSNIRSVGYEKETMTFEVEFNSGSVYQYHSVPETVYMAFMKASSKGSYLNQKIKDHYSFREVR